MHSDTGIMRHLAVLLLGIVLLDCAQYNADPGIMGLLLLRPAGSTAVWANPSFRYRRKIKFGTAHSALLRGYTASISINTQTSEGRVQLASGNDVRIYYQPVSGSPVELDRIGDTWNAGSTAIEFRLPAALDANLDEPADAAYYVYYGDASAGTPGSDEMNVYYFADFFNRADSTNVGNGWTEWTTGGTSNMAISSSRLCGNGNDGSMDAGVKQTFSLGAIPSDFTLSFDWGVQGQGQATWVHMVQIGDSASMLNTNMATGVGPAIYMGEGGSLTPNNLYNMDYDASAPGQLESGVIADATATTILSIRLVVNTTARTYNYYRAGALVYTGATFENAVTLDQIRIAMDNWSNGLTCYSYNNLKISLDASDGPETYLDAEESI
jgi:hypothetical protein